MNSRFARRFRMMLFALALMPASTIQAQRELKDIPVPDPELERQTFQLPEGFEVNLFAADPKIAKPIQMNFDPQGRLWIVSSETYPQVIPGGKANDKVLIVQDHDGDGVSDSTQVFAEGLLIPTGIAPGDGGAYVGASTELLFFKDSDGDGRADHREIMLSGFGTEDTHHIIHTFRWGPERLLYFSQSIYIHSHIETPWGVRRLNAGGIWQFRPETLQLDVLARGWVNSWGTAFDRWGQTFVTDGAGGEGINFMVPGASYATAYGAARILPGLNPGSPKHCGLEIVDSDALPDDWRGNCITNDFRGHRVCRFVLTEDGTAFRSQEQQEVIKSNHVAFRPVDVKQGPDGAIYIADWYNPIIQHGEVDFRDPRRDHTHGRIWRVTYKGKPTRKPQDLTQLGTADLLANLQATDGYIRQQSKQVLKERGADTVVPELVKWTQSLTTDQDRLEALWMWLSFETANGELLERLLASADHRIRAAAVRVLGHWLSDIGEPLAKLRLRIHDEHPRVRMEAVRVLSLVKSAEAASIAMEALDHEVDMWLDYALWQTARDLQPEWESAVASGKLDLGNRAGHLAFLLNATSSTAGVPMLVSLLQGGRVSAGDLPKVLSVVSNLGNGAHLRLAFDIALDDKVAPELRTQILNSLANAARSRNAMPEGDLASLATLLKSDQANVWSAAVNCIGAWKLASLREPLAVIAADGNRPLGQRVQALRMIAEFSDEAAVARMRDVARDPLVPGLQRVAIEELLRLRPEEGARLSVGYLQSVKNADETVPLFESLLRRKGAAALLTKALADQSLPKDVAIIGTRIVGSSGQEAPELLEQLRRAGQLAAQAVTLSPEQMAAMTKEVQEQGNPVLGEAVYRRADLNCIKCHAVGPAGGLVGPNLVSLGSTAQLDYIIESLLDPNAKIKEGFHTLIVATDEGQVFSGIKLRESETAMILRDAEDREISVPLTKIEQQKQGATLMPAGLTNTLTHAELVHLSAFLSALGRLPDYTVGTVPVVRHWDGMQPTDDAAFQLRRTSYSTAAADPGRFQWSRTYSHVDGNLPIDEIPGVRVRNRVAPGDRGVAFVRFPFATEQAGAVQFRLNSSAGLQIWLDGLPVEAAQTVSGNVDAGSHWMTFAVDPLERREPLRVEVVPAGGVPVVLPNGK